MKNIVNFLFLFLLFQHTYGQNIHKYLPHPNEDKISEISYIYDNGKYWQKEIYYYTEDMFIDNIEEQNPFNILISTEKYYYDSKNRIDSIHKLNTFNQPIEKKIYDYYPEEYVIKIHDRNNELEEVESYDLQDRIIERLTFLGEEPSYKYLYEYLNTSSKDYNYYTYKPDGTLKEKQFLRFNENGDKSEIQTFDSNDVMISTQQFDYNLNNQIVASKKHDAEGKIIRRTLFNYNKENAIVSRVTTVENDEFSDKKVFNYDERNRLIKETVFGREILKDTPKLQSEVLYFYNDNNNLLELHRYNTYTKEIMIGGKEFFDNQNRLIKANTYHLGKISKETIYEKGLKKEQIRYDEEEAVFDISKFEYDKNGNLLVVSVRRSDGTEKEKFGYKYDVNGNKTLIEN